METYNISEFVPHSGRMSLLDEVLEFGDGWLKARLQIKPESMFVEKQGVSAVVGIEYLAQGIAAYAGSKERQSGLKPKLGFLLGCRKYQSSVDYFPVGSALTIEVQLEMEADNGLNVFNAVLRGNGFEASAKLNVFQPDDAEAFLKGESQ
ncbi:hypothetical protein Q4574_17240 [Aliiglaciecola sp. 3_MG-2023]|uniref:ApeP family dehydratase n=1 Tax=Aliiglaciecola sp. 3_MG-2023 TaxID=3062644 RepID=UPI0026E46D77|nr:hypothetical protein [Aliiglaciecola sp. 3_MG-2023]MDO6695046.1 hypothetical protein [Aliiglaciecola sp. 3_MG-2023]